MIRYYLYLFSIHVISKFLYNQKLQPGALFLFKRNFFQIQLKTWKHMLLDYLPIIKRFLSHTQRHHSRELFLLFSRNILMLVYLPKYFLFIKMLLIVCFPNAIRCPFSQANEEVQSMRQDSLCTQAYNLSFLKNFLVLLHFQVMAF